MIVSKLGRILLLAMLVTLPSCEGGSSSDIDGHRVVVITVTPGTPVVEVGGTVQLAALARDVSSQVVPNTTFVWSSFNTSVATVDGNGIVTGVSPGDAIVDARIVGVAVTAGSASVTVVAPAAAPSGDR